MATVAPLPMRLALVGGLAAALGGCALLGLPPLAGQPATVRAATGQARPDQAVAAAERAVLLQPSEAARRVALGRAYLRAGRLDSAIAAFTDALALGDASPATVLGLALGRIAAGEREEAVRLLDRGQGAIPPGDRGLALALAGESSRGAAVLLAALREGQGDARLRQNLAYAYALGGRWREAAWLAALDLPSDQVRARIEAWAALASPSDARRRVGYVLGVPLRADPGYPAALALAPAEPTSPAAELAAAPSP